MVLARCNDSIWLERRPATGIWGGLWSFPEVDPVADMSAWCESVFNVSPLAVEPLEVVRHSFTHFDLEILPLAVRIDDCSRKVADATQGAWHDLHDPGKLGLAAPVASLLEDQVFRKMLGVITNVQARNKNILRGSHLYAASWLRPVDPEHAELAELIGTEGVRSAWIAPRHIPSVLEEDGTIVVCLGLSLEHCAVEVCEFGLDEFRHVDIAR